MYSYQEIISGIQYTVYFFSSFSGHIHPYTPINPIDVVEVNSCVRKTYYKAWYSMQDEGPRLDKLQKIWIMSEPSKKLDFSPVKGGNYYFEAVKTNGNWVYGEQFKVEDTLTNSHYYRCRVDKDNVVDQCDLVFTSVLWEHAYVYSPGGALVSTDSQVKPIPDRIE
ncbi:hypothetical protein [Teredinibacter haidensis]|uniref:hypothetical protein n=1 Tax=Teredinibacter haidensis TaxID=2731755 RepID=UPI00094890AB|nr:hypothetical protein [Teredinibacter haidensis]